MWPMFILVLFLYYHLCQFLFSFVFAGFYVHVVQDATRGAEEGTTLNTVREEIRSVGLTCHGPHAPCFVVCGKEGRYKWVLHINQYKDWLSKFVLYHSRSIFNPFDDVDNCQEKLCEIIRLIIVTKKILYINQMKSIVTTIIKYASFQWNTNTL